MILPYYVRQSFSLSAGESTSFYVESYLTARVHQPIFMLFNWQLDPLYSTVTVAATLAQVINLGSSGAPEDRGTVTKSLQAVTGLAVGLSVVWQPEVFFIQSESEDYPFLHQMTLTNEHSTEPAIVQLIIQGLYDDTIMVV